MSSAPSQVGQTLHHSEGTSGGQVITHAEADWAEFMNSVAAFNHKVWVVQMRDGLYGTIIGT